MRLDHRFKASGGAPISESGRMLHWTYTVPVGRPGRFEIRILSAKPAPVQGIGLHTDHCEMRVGDTVGHDLVLWRDTAPEAVEIAIQEVHGSCVLRISNQWRDPVYQTTMYRLNDACMEVSPEPDGALLFRCSDGASPLDLSDLVFVLRTR